MAIIQYFCAGKIGETLGIQKDSIDFKNRILNISHTAIFNSSKTFWYLSDLTKTDEDRTVHITDTLRDALLSRINDGDKNCSFVIQYQGKPLNYGTALLHYNKALKKLGLPYSGTHILRHGCASLARTLTGSLDACMSMTGHRDIRVAENYAELSDKVKIGTSLQVEEHLNKLKKAGPNSGFQLIQ